MKISQAVGVAALAAGTAVSQSRDDDLSTAEQEVKQLVAAIERKAFAELGNRDKTFGCTAENIVYRQEYGDLSKDQRLDYIKAVQCLMSLPANTPSDYAPGAKSRYDDFVVTHINHTLDAHYTGNFMAWHRWFIYTYETALRDECGYQGYQPYWDWPKYAPAPQDSPIFNGDPYSLGGNGAWDPDLPASVVTLPEGVTGDPFTLPGGSLAGGSPPNPRADGLGYNPRRLRRDVGPAIGERYANWTTVWDLLRKPNITEYRFLSEGGFNNGEIGPHGGGHYMINGDPGGDLWVSPAEPTFFVHHGNMDRMWTLWQAIDPENRTVLLDEGPYGHTTWNNEPPSPLTTMDDVINIGWAGPPTTMREMMSTTSGPLCYFYK
ncbi:tyrosinase [Apiospora aurea]|uniref:Tyrosinase n=1 Tax=Apiospora aurea TaxID=335848 RepID=A0ABR1QMZ4_9PEZI